MSAKIEDVQAIWDARVRMLGEYATDRIGSTKEEKDAERVQRFEFIKKHLPDDLGSVLDYGCGTGLMSDLFITGQYIGCDTSKKMIDLARQKYPQHTFYYAAWVFDPEGIDTLFIATVLQHNEEQTIFRILNMLASVKTVVLYENTDDKLKDTENIAYRPPDWYMQKVFDYTEKEPVDIISHTIHKQKHSLMIFR